MGDAEVSSRSRILAGVPLFAGLPNDDLDTLAASLTRHRYAKGEVIWIGGEPATDLCIVEQGSVRIVLTSADGREVVLASLGMGEFFGELALFDGTTGPADVIAQEDCSLLRLQRERVLAFLRTHPHTAELLLAVLSRRLRETDTLVYDTTFRDVPSRLARAVLKLAASHGRREADGIVLGRRLTQEDLAAMIGSSRVSVNKWFKLWERQGLIASSGGVIKILRPAELWPVDVLGEPSASDVALPA
jgi:CRP/FNR family transcriptional regulator, cyclic AMP receptor protein